MVHPEIWVRYLQFAMPKSEASFGKIASSLLREAPFAKIMRIDVLCTILDSNLVEIISASSCFRGYTSHSILLYSF